MVDIIDTREAGVERDDRRRRKNFMTTILYMYVTLVIVMTHSWSNNKHLTHQLSEQTTFSMSGPSVHALSR